MFEETYQLSNWINAVKIKNKLNPDIKIDILALQNSSGYIMTVYEGSTSNILYRVPVECSLSNNWSLSTLEAIGLLNTIGFPCEWVGQKIITSSVYKYLKQLQSFGWVNLIRSIRPADVFVFDSEGRENSLRSMMPTFNYKDWEFLVTNIPTSIDELLNNVKSSEEDEEDGEGPATES